jgi:hypothetical protein
MNNPMIVQIANAGRDPVQPGENLAFWHSVGVSSDDLVQRLAADILHDHPGVVVGVAANVVQGQQIGMLEIDAMRDASQFDVEVAAD